MSSRVRGAPSDPPGHLPQRRFAPGGGNRDLPGLAGHRLGCSLHRLGIPEVSAR